MSDIEQKHFSRPFELKALNDDGTFSGYAATFDLDLGGDIIATTAFDDWMRREGCMASRSRRTDWYNHADAR